VVEVCRRVGRPVLVDASGPGLEAALAAGPDIVKIGRVEAVDAGVVEARASTMEAAGALVDRGATLAIVTDGAREVAAADATTTWRVAPPRIEAVNAVGSGDSFNAGFSLALLDGADIATALSRGVAAGSANALSLGAAMLDPDVASELEHHITVATTKR
jgi:fructose-1-phosphate kinase PfkB-like protein